MDLFQVGPDTDLRLAKSVFGDKKIALMGNLDGVKDILNPDQEELSKKVKSVLDIGKPNGGFAISAGGVVNAGTPKENLELIFKLAKSYGSYES